jgi:pimeloyl-ACP methyl ester carboxylesterase
MLNEQIATNVVLRIAVFLLFLGAFGCDRFQPPGESSPAAPALRAVTEAITTHPPDGFYEPPAERPSRTGMLVRSEPLKEVKLPGGMRGWRILYATTIDDNTPAWGVATVFAPINPPAGPRPVIAWAHGTTGVLQKCMPSLVSAPTVGIPAINRVVSEGWVIVATDYSFAEKNGPHPFLIGEGEARAVLDSVRAAQQMPELTLDEQTVVWGHSQGGHSALWTGIIGPRYAPDVKVIGVAAIAPAADIKNLIEINPSVDRRLGPYVALAYSRFYKDVKFDEALRPEALTAGREMVNLCGFLPPEDPKRIASLTTTFRGRALATDTNKALAARLAQNAANGAIPAPLVIAQGLADNVVLPAATDVYVDQRCTAGQRLEYWKFAGKDHGGLVQAGTPLEASLVEWTKARFSDEPQPSGCSRNTF